MGADISAENTPEFICPLRLPKPRRSGFQWKRLHWASVVRGRTHMSDSADFKDIIQIILIHNLKVKLLSFDEKIVRTLRGSNLRFFLSNHLVHVFLYVEILKWVFLIFKIEIQSFIHLIAELLHLKKKIARFLVSNHKVVLL